MVMDSEKARGYFDRGLEIYKANQRMDGRALALLLSGSELVEYLTGNEELALEKIRQGLENLGADQTEVTSTEKILRKRLQCVSQSLPKATCIVQGIVRSGVLDQSALEPNSSGDASLNDETL